MKTTDIIIIVLVLFVVLLVLMRNVSGLAPSPTPAATTAPSDTSGIQPSIVSYVAALWKDIDITDTRTWTAATLVSGTVNPTGGANPVSLNNVSLKNLNSLMWDGSNVLSNGQTIRLPAGVTPENVFGVRKALQENKKDIWFFTIDPTPPTKLIRTCEDGMIWVSNDPQIGRVILPDHVIVKKSLKDPSPVQNCKYDTPKEIGCSAIECGTSGFKKYEISGYAAPINGGTCPAYKGGQIIGNGTITSTDTCKAPDCQRASFAAVNRYLF